MFKTTLIKFELFTDFDKSMGVGCEVVPELELSDAEVRKMQVHVDGIFNIIKYKFQDSEKEYKDFDIQELIRKLSKRN
jgi:2-keto-4-pentenoate hydratase/2-oxohepta-3-ene-1,7-dioic acid hydratase in catechol pathway